MGWDDDSKLSGLHLFMWSDKAATMSDQFNIIDTKLEGLKIIQRNPIADQRGYFERLFSLNDFMSITHGDNIVHINHSLTVNKGAVRGMHFQRSPYSEAKFVTCLRGKVFDVAVDLRRGSPTFLQWHAEVLSAENHASLFIPKGFAHGFQTMIDHCEMLYFHTVEYQPTYEGAINPQDPMLSIRWPQAIVEMSERDRTHPMLLPNFKGLKL